jgi:hypothetical protein
MAHEIDFHCHSRRAYSVHVDRNLVGNIRRIGVGADSVWSVNIPGLNANVTGRHLGSTEPSRVHFRHIADARSAVTNHINGGGKTRLLIATNWKGINDGSPI